MNSGLLQRNLVLKQSSRSENSRINHGRSSFNWAKTLWFGSGKVFWADTELHPNVKNSRQAYGDSKRLHKSRAFLSFTAIDCMTLRRMELLPAAASFVF
jgi:hypothetical protein